MLIRFTEFIEHEGRELNLYVVQENEGPGNLCFRVYIKDGTKGMMNLCRNVDNDWIVNAEEGPLKLDTIKPVLISIINKRISRNDFALAGLK